MEEHAGMIGRGPEAALLSARAADACTGGGGAVVFLSGEAGVGKSHLVQAVLATQPVRVFNTTSLAGLTPAYGPVLQCLRAWRQEEPAEFKALGGRAAPVASCLDGGLAPGVPVESLREALVGAVLAIARRRPSAWVLDDVHHADAATLELLTLLGLRVKDSALLVVGIYQSNEVGRDHPLRRLRATLRKSPRFVEFTVEPFSLKESLRMMRECLGAEPAPALAQALHERTQGVPLYIEEFCTALKAGGCLFDWGRGLELAEGREVPLPERLQDALLLRLHSLPSGERAFVEAAAVDGVEFDWALAGQTSGQPAGGDALIEQGLVRAGGAGRGVFAHPLFQEAVLAALPWSRRRALHAAVARRLEAAGAPPDRLVRHYEATGDQANARAAWLAVAERACGLHAHEDAFRAFERAMAAWAPGEDESARAEALGRYVECARASGHLQEASRGLTELLASALLAADLVKRGETWRALAAVQVQEGAVLASIESHRSAARDYEAAGRLADAAEDWYAISELGLVAVRLSEARAACERAIELAARADRPALRARALSQLALLCATLAQPEEARRFIEAALMLALEHDLPEEAAVAYRRLASTLEFASNYLAEVEAYGEALSYCSSRGLEAQQALCMGCLSYALFRSGEWSQCQRTARQVLRRKDAPPVSRCGAQLALSLVALHRGELKTARRVLQDFDREVRAGGLLIYELFSLWELAMLEQLEGRPAGADAHFLRLLDTWERTEDRHEVLPGLRAAATFYARQGRAAETNRCARAAGRIASVSGNPEASATLAYVLGEAAFSAGKADESLPHFARACALFRQHELMVDGLWADARLGEVMCLEGSAEEGRRVLRDALGRARRLGARPLVVQIESALSDAPSSAAEPDSPWTCLSTRQQEVARCLVEGLTNKEVAARLHLSTRTVDMHVRHIFDRLACRSRAEAVSRLLQREKLH
jgi:DNA-binding CsgD family transcriptional regulator